jgi:hypothetical protein
LSYGVFAVITLGAWMLDPAGPQEWTQMLEAAAAAWLSGLGLAPTIGGVTITLLPWGFAVVLILALIGAARWASEASAVGRPGEALAVALSAGMGFAVVSALVAGLGRSLQIAPLAAAGLGAALAFLVTLAVMWRCGAVNSSTRVSPPLRDMLASAGVGLLVLVLAASVALGFALIAHVDEVSALLISLDAGPSGLLLLVVLSLGYLPVAVIWSIAYLLGAGIQVAVGSTVAPFADTVPASLPGFPLLAVLPSVSPTGAILLPAVGVVAGAAAGALLRRRGHGGLRQGTALAVGAAVLAGLVLAVSAWLASGSLGTATLVDLGPSPLMVGLTATVLMAVGALAVTVWSARRVDV